MITVVSISIKNSIMAEIGTTGKTDDDDDDDQVDEDDINHVYSVSHFTDGNY